MQGKKDLLSRFMHGAQMFRFMKELRRDMVVIFGWHRVLPDVDVWATPFADDVLGPRAAELDHCFEWFANNVRVLSESELIEVVAGRMRPGRLSVVLTFDDGYADNYTLALPLLEKHGLPAIFFVPTQRIDERNVGWVDLIPYAIKHTGKRELTRGGQTFYLPENRGAAVAHLHKTMQLEKHAKTAKLVDELFDELEVERPAKPLMDAQLMTWDQLRDASNRGVAIASHTHSHRVLATLEPHEQKQELARSKALLEEKLGRPARTIAYPVGGYAHFDQTTQHLAREVGYELGLSYCTGFNRFGAIAPYDVKRIGPPLEPALLFGTTVLPEVFDWESNTVY